MVADKRMGAFDVRHKMFNPLWSRLLVAGLTCGLALVELANGNPFWAILFGAAGIHLVYQFFVVWTPVETKPEEDRDG
jgi:hypothetical protein